MRKGRYLGGTALLALLGRLLMTADWTAIGGERWTLPVGGGGGKLSRVGKVGLPVNVQLAAFYNAIKPDEAADWQLRFQIRFLFPK